MSLFENFAHHGRRLRGSDRYPECLRVLLALGGIVVYGWISAHVEQVIPLLLGTIACALAETEDYWRNRLSTLSLTLFCFAAAALGFEWLMPHPLIFALALPSVSFALVMLGAVSARYATIAGATLILSVYTMLARDSLGASDGQFLALPLQLLMGALWYGLLSLLWSALSPQQAVRHALARLFDALADYLQAKAALLPPVRGVDHQAMRVNLARCNERVVIALEETRAVLVDRIGSGRARGATAQRLRLYLAAQDIHERASSALMPYDALAEAFFHSDVLFRCESLLRLQAAHCRRHANALRMRLTIPKNAAAIVGLNDIQTSITALRAVPAAPDLLSALSALSRNLQAIQQSLEDESLNTPEDDETFRLLDPAPHSLAEAWARVRLQFNPGSFRFRHAVRLSIALLLGYIILRAVHPQNGYWILLTTVFVCQPSYAATYRRFLERVGGTIFGVVVGWAALRLLPEGPWQWLLAVAAGVVFFATRLRWYTTATTVVTVFVVLCFNQLGHGYTVMWPRIIDTVIGAVLAALALRWILPDWRQRRLTQVMADTVEKNACYLDQIIRQYASGKQDDLPYRIARRDAHTADAGLSGVASSLLREPGQRARSERLLRFLSGAHTMLGHLSALGAHRQRLARDGDIERVREWGAFTVAALESLAEQLRTGRPPPMSTSRLAQLPVDHASDDEITHLVLEQLSRVLAQYDALAALIDDLRNEI